MNESAKDVGPRWFAKIDYLSLTSSSFHFPPHDASVAHYDAIVEADMAWARIFAGNVPSAPVNEFYSAAPRSGYTRSAAHPVGARYYAGSAVAAPLLELGGAACDYLNAAGVLLPLVQRECEGVTRIDLAADLICDVSPADFVAAGRSKRHRTSRSAKSDTGDTEYIGSPTSDRSAKVYRYAAPHPRSAALRVEITLRRELAKSAAQRLCEEHVSTVFAAASEPFSFKHPLWRQPEASHLSLMTMRNEPTNASRLSWLVKQIKPAVLNAHKAGLIDLSAWLDEALTQC